MDARAADILPATAVEGLRFICASSALRALRNTRTPAGRSTRREAMGTVIHGGDARGWSVDRDHACPGFWLIDPKRSQVAVQHSE